MLLNVVHRPLVTPEVDLGCSPVLANIYASRGITEPCQLQLGTKGLLHFQQFNGIDSAAEIIAQSIIEQRNIVVVGDFDADGATSTALCMLALQDFGAANYQYLVPNRFDFGYGLSPEIVDVAAAKGAQLIVTVDNGISCVAGVAHARSLGIDVVVTDHHLAGQHRPDANAIVNPNQHDCTFPSKHIAGVGVAFYVMSAVRNVLIKKQWFENQQRQMPNLANYLDLVALGTVADVVCLDHNNRILVHQGLQRIRARQCRPGILAILDVAKRPAHKLQATDLGFALGPRLNAAGRLDDMSLGIECLITADHSQAKTIAAELDMLNSQRKDIETGMQQEAHNAIETVQLDDAEPPLGLVLYQQDWHQGVIGIVAGRIKEKYYRPTIAFAHQDDQIIKGSARSIPGVHIRDVLESVNTASPGLIDKFGGHAMAAGLSLPRQNLDAFTKAFQTALSAVVDDTMLSQTIETDGELQGHQLSMDVAQLLQDGGPWGQGFPEPTFSGVMRLDSQRIVGEKHLKISLMTADGILLDGIAFNVDTSLWPVAGRPDVQVVYTLDINEFRQRQSLQLMIKDIQLVKA